MILIISVENDGITNDICASLVHQKKEFVRINESQYITDVFFDFTRKQFEFTINNIVYNLNQFSSVYYRNGTIVYKDISLEIDSPIKLFYETELSSITEFIFHYLHKNCKRIYGNIINKKVNKLEVLHLAGTLGFKIPQTYVFSNPKCLEFLTDVENKLITKSISEMSPILYKNELYLNYTREISLDEILGKTHEIIPSLIQDRIHVEYELRVFFFENKIWAIAMFDFENNVDVRNVRSKKFIPYELPYDIQEKIFAIASKLELKTGTIDLLKSNDDFYFLEVNPSGQFQDLNYWGNYNIDQYIAEQL